MANTQNSPARFCVYVCVRACACMYALAHKGRSSRGTAGEAKSRCRQAWPRPAGAAAESGPRRWRAPTSPSIRLNASIWYGLREDYLYTSSMYSVSHPFPPTSLISLPLYSEIGQTKPSHPNSAVESLSALSPFTVSLGRLCPRSRRNR